MNELNLAFAFTAGVFATVNPCGWAMLPSFVSYYLGSGEDNYEKEPLASRIYEGLYMGFLVTAGFLTIFGTAGAVISAGLRVIVKFMPLAALIVGVGLLLLGLWLLSGKSLPFSIPTPKMDLRARNPKTVFLFGMAYAFASLSCTLPVFLAVIGASLTTTGVAGVATMFGSYAAGMALVLLSVSIGAALFKGVVEQWFRKLLPHVNQFGAMLLVVAGLYLIVNQGRYLPLLFASF